MKKLWDSRILRWVTPVAWMGVIFYLSAQPELPDLTHGRPDVQDVAGHFILYTVLALLWWRALRQAGVPHSAWWGWVIALAYGISDEFHQRFVPNRQADPLDIATDAAGAMAALVVVHLGQQWIAGRRRAYQRPSSSRAAPHPDP